MRPRLLALLFVVQFAGPAVAVSQTICADCRVRVTAPTVLNGPVEARVERLGPDTLFVQATKSLALPFSQVTSLEVYAGTRGHAGTGAFVGGGLLGLTALAVGFSLQSSQECLIDIGFGSGKCEYSTEEVLAFGAFSAALGAGLGAIIGAAVRTARWEVVPLESLRIEPTIDAMAVSVMLPVRLGR